MHRWATSPALRWRSSEREKKLSNRLAVSSFFQSFWRDRRRLSPISQLICQISQLIFDRSHVNASDDVPACKVIDLWTINRLCVRGPNVRVAGQRKQRMESENAFLFPSLAVWGWTVNPFHSQSTFVSLCVAVFIHVGRDYIGGVRGVQCFHIEFFVKPPQRSAPLSPTSTTCQSRRAPSPTTGRLRLLPLFSRIGEKQKTHPTIDQSRFSLRWEKSSIISKAKPFVDTWSTGTFF